jgi:hypothetical protein
MTEEQVKNILGDPLYKANYGIPNEIVWEYSTDGTAIWDFSWYEYSVAIHDGKVRLKEIDEFFD